MTVTSADLQEWLGRRRDEVEAALLRFLTNTSATTPAIIGDAMRYSLFAGGKRFRPMLVLAAAEAVALRARQPVDEALALALPAACAVELIHTYSLIHDDLPAMDNDTLRRGRPTAHVVFGDGMAILAGDALLTEAFVLLAREPQQTDTGPVDVASRKLRALRAIAEAAGARGMVGGQAMDLQAAAAGASRFDETALRAMHARKTGALITGSAVAGAIMAGASPDVTAAIQTYAEHLGLAFQIVDDILDVEGASADLGKTAGKDAAAGKPTYPSAFGLERSRRLAADAIDRALDALARTALGGQLPPLARWVLSRTH